MLRNYIKIAFRGILRSKVFSLINISGLSLGIACCLLLYLYVADELSYDTHHKDVNDLYRIDTQFSGLAGFDKIGSVSPPIPMGMKEEIPEIAAVARIISPVGVAQSLIKSGDKIFYETDGYIADSTLFDVLSYELSEGIQKKP